MSASRRSPGPARWLLSAPLLAFLALLVGYPVWTGVTTSLQHHTLLEEPFFTGLDNFASTFTDRGFWAALGFTARFTGVVVVVEMVLGLGLALLYDRRFPGKAVFLTATLLPIMIAPALLGVMFRLLLNEDFGAVPALLDQVGLDVSLFAPGSVFWLLTVLDVVQWTPFTFLIFYTGLQGVPRDLYEAAAIDGAGYWRTVLRIVLPVLRPVTMAALFLRAVDAIRTFDVVYVLTGGGAGGDTSTLSIYIYKKAFQDGDFGGASAASVVVLVALLPLLPWLVRRIAGTARPKEASR